LNEMSHRHTGRSNHGSNTNGNRLNSSRCHLNEEIVNFTGAN
jgi:hypothetical protein